jgi:hypothetical protein
MANLAGSPSLFAFGGDSAIALFSAVVVLRRFRATAAHEDAERRTARVAGAFVVRAGCLCCRHFDHKSTGA